MKELSALITDLARSLGFLSRLPVAARFFEGHSGDMSRTPRAFPLAGVVIAAPAGLFLALLVGFDANATLAAFAAAPMAKTSGLKISLQATKLATAGFVVPFMAVYTPALMLQDAGPIAAAWGYPVEVAYVFFKACFGIGLWGAAVVSETGCDAFGRTPSRAQIMALAGWLARRSDAEVFVQLAPGTRFELLDVAGEWVWGCPGPQGPSGWCRASELAPAEG